MMISIPNGGGFLFCCDVFSFRAMFFPNHDISMFSFVNNVYEMLVHIHYSYIISIRVCFVKNCMVIKGYLVRRNNTPRPIEAHKQSIETTHIEDRINNKVKIHKDK